MRIARAVLATILGLTLAAAVLGEERTSSWTTFSPRGRESASPLLRRGEEAYQARCNLCHGRVAKDITPGMGGRMPGTEALEAKYRGQKPAVLEDRTDLTAGLVKQFVRNGVGIMPFLRKTELSDADLEAIAAYLSRNTHKSEGR
jgi:mono/diheme cytochrome c family protein